MVGELGLIVGAITVQIAMNSFSFTEKMKFSFWGLANFWRQMKLNKNGKINTWAIFWYAVIFKNQGLCLTPKQSFAKNIGFDGSGVHTTAENAYKNERVLNNQSNFHFEKIKVKESSKAIKKAYWFYFMEGLIKLFRKAFRSEEHTSELQSRPHLVCR